MKTQTLAMLLATAALTHLAGCADGPTTDDGDRLDARDSFGKTDTVYVCLEVWYDDGVYCDYYCEWGCGDPDCALVEAFWSEECVTGTCGGLGDECIDAPCCDGFYCNGETSTCWADEPVCGGLGDECIDAPCCDGFYCNGETSTCWADEPVCGGLGDECIDAPCCDGFYCNGETSTCLPNDAVCASHGEACDFGSCCDGLFCYSETWTCESETACAEEGEACIDWFCCDGLTCEGDTCVRAD